ncbi:MAG: SIMPL domain-containing protein [Candidatus Pacearchaeota archaeon]|nr:SIMPL domain-containing protein [Candidatus Pacearchaeota archaeon]
MEKSVQITLIIVIAVLVIAGLATFLILQGKTPSNTISVQGNALLKADPDLVTVYFRVETNASTAQEAKDKNAEIVNKATANLVKVGIPKDKIQTLDFNIYPEYDWIDGQQKFRGYKAVHSFKVELETAQIDKVGAVIDAGVDAGSLIDYINFELSTAKQNEYKAEALKQASQDAKTKAEAMVSGLGKKLGKLVSVSDMSFDYYPWPIYRAMESSSAEEAKAAVTNITPSEKEIIARVSVVYQIV